MDKNDEKLILYAGLAIGGYLLYKQFLANDQNPAQKSNMFERAGFTENQSNLPGHQFFQTYDVFTNENVTYGIRDTDQLNFAQRILLGFDSIVPGTWLSRMALE